MQRAAAAGKPHQAKEIELEFPDGQRTTISGQAVPLFDANGRVRGAIGAFADVTEIKRDHGSQMLENVLSHDINADVAVDYKTTGIDVLIKLKNRKIL